MTTAPISAVVQYQNGTASDWSETTTPVPLGMVIIASDTGEIKMGDGETLYASLPVLITIKRILSCVSSDPASFMKALNGAISASTFPTTKNPNTAQLWRDPNTGALYFS